VRESGFDELLSSGGVLKKFFEDSDDTDYPSISFELLESDDEVLHAKISIARNFQN